MFVHYLIIALRNIRKYILQNAVSIVGLVAGFVAFALSSLWMSYVDSYDLYHKDADRIYTFSFNEDGRTTVGNERTRTNGDIFYNLFRTLDDRGQLDVLGVESFMYYDENQGFNYNDEDLCLCIDSAFLDFFNPVLLAGDWSFMEDPTKIAVSRSRAEREYGDESPIGKVIRKRNNSYTVSAVVDDFDHSYLKYDYLKKWNSYSIYSYKWLFFKLQEGVTLDEMLERCGKIFEATGGNMSLDNAMRGKTIIPLKKVFRALNENKEETFVKYNGLNMLSKASLLILICAIVNHFTFFLNYLRGRRREIILRKVNGASTLKIALQMIIESSIPVLIALFLGLFAVLMLKNSYMQLAGIGMTDSYYLKGSIIIMLAVITVSITISLIEVLVTNRNTMQSGLSRQSNDTFRKVSIGIQITSGMMFMFALIVMYNQFSYMRNINWGTKKKDVAIIYIKQPEVEKEYFGNGTFRYVGGEPDWGDIYLDKLQSKYGLKEKIEAIPCITGVFMNFADISRPPYNNATFITPTAEMTEPLFPDVFDLIYPGMTDRLGLTVLQGSIPEEGLKDDEVVMTDNLFKAIGGDKLEDKPEVYLSIDNTSVNKVAFKVMAVIKNIHRYNFDDIPPYIILCGYHNKYLIDEYSYGEKRGGGSIDGTLSVNYLHNSKNELEVSLKELFDGLSLKYEIIYPDESFFEHLSKDKNLSTLLLILCMTSILIALFGIWSQITLTCTERKREIAIRKAHGAKVRDILSIFAREYGVIFLVSSAVAFASGFIVMHRWLQQFYYQATISWWIYLSVLAFTVMVIVATVLNRVLTTARENPADVIKSE